MTTRVKGRAETSPADDEFLQQLQRGGELLAANKVIEAKEFLERAHQLQPRNEKAQNLLGLCYFKLGLFDRAAELYEMLVRDNPVDPTLRVNLGLVYLKTNALQRAVREFETATDLSPEHQKAQNYLGLALAQMGEYGRAREHFLLAGSDQMADKMSRAIAGENYSRPTPAPVSPP
ncbi:M48 family metallopeptidase, partial [Myxococcus sp. CA039A]